MDSLQRTAQQLRSELGRYKNRAHRAEQQVAKVGKGGGGGGGGGGREDIQQQVGETQPQQDLHAHPHSHV